MTELATKSESEDNSSSNTSLKSTSGIQVLETPSIINKPEKRKITKMNLNNFF